MPRIMIKGGVWRNTEDEILKAAVMKYGKNQWSRIASLLHRKSAKQCKARWYEWLDPSIKKTEWSREEEEKLLHLAKLMPTQWRTIASIVGRTASQCLEHYDQLLDQAQKKDEDAGEGSSSDPRKIKPGEIDPNPETKPARPDPKDMDEDELEMLSEARARLANTQGKKAKRKAREKQLEEARRLASLQKRRELKMAGINIGIGGRKRKRGIDYNAEIPFEKPVPAGLHDVSEEEFIPPTHDFRRLRQQQLDGELRAEREEKERKKDKKLLGKKKENDPQSLLQAAVAFAASKPRSKLVLPEPQVTDLELEQVVKLGRASELAKDLASEEGGHGSEILLADYSLNTESVSNLRTPRSTINSRDSILMEAQNLMALQNVETPLKGGLNTPLHMNESFGQSVLTPSLAKQLSVVTPNSLISTPFRTPGAAGFGDGGATPASVRSDSTDVTGTSISPSTPALRDKLTINPDTWLNFESQEAARSFQREHRDSLKKALTNLPAPKNEYEIVMNDDVEEEASTIGPDIGEDQGDIDARREEEEAARIEAEVKKQSQAVQRNLPRPIEVNHAILKPSGPTDAPLTELQEAEELIKLEMIKMLHHDALVNPSEIQILRTKTSHPHQEFLSKNPLEEISMEEICEASDLLKEEMILVREGMAHGEVTLESYTEEWDKCWNELMFVPSEGRYKPKRYVSKKDKVEAAETKLSSNRDQMTKEAKKASKVEKRLKTYLTGYKNRAESLLKQFHDITESIEQTKLELETFKTLQNHEDVAINKRIEVSTEETLPFTSSDLFLF